MVVNGSLYLMKITHNGMPVYKIGVTARDVETRAHEHKQTYGEVTIIKSFKIYHTCLAERIVDEAFAHRRYRETFGEELFDLDQNDLRLFDTLLTALVDFEKLLGADR